jgi:hypothetical protein
MSIYTKVANFVAPVPMYMASRSLNEAQSAQYALTRKFNSNEEKIEQLKLAIKRDSVKFLNEWDLDYSMGFDLLVEIIKKVIYFKKLTFMTREKIDPKIFALMSLKRIDELFFMDHSPSNDEELLIFINNLKYLSTLHLSDTSVSITSNSLVNLIVKHGPSELNLNDLPRLKTFKSGSYGWIKITLPEFQHPLEILSAPQASIEFTNKNYKNYFSHISFLEELKISVDRNGHADFLIDAVLNNEGVLDINTPPHWDYFKEGDKLKYLSIIVDHRNIPAYRKFTPNFPKCEEIRIWPLLGYSLEKLPKNIKDLSLFFGETNYGPMIGSIKDLPLLEDLYISTRWEGENPIMKEFLDLPESLKRIRINLEGYHGFDGGWEVVDFDIDSEKIPCPIKFVFETEAEMRVFITGKLSYKCNIEYAEICAVYMEKEHERNNLNFIEIDQNVLIARYEFGDQVCFVYDHDLNSEFFMKKGILHLIEQMIDDTFSFYKPLPLKIIDSKIKNFSALSIFPRFEISNSVYIRPDGTDCKTIEEKINLVREFLNVEEIIMFDEEECTKKIFSNNKIHYDRIDEKCVSLVFKCKV